MLTILAWPIVTFICILIYKRILIPYTPPYSLSILTDVILLMIMFILSIKRHSRTVRVVQAVLALYIIIFNWADICIFLSLYNRLTFENFISNVSYVTLIPQFISAKIIIFSISII